MANRMFSVPERKIVVDSVSQGKTNKQIVAELSAAGFSRSEPAVCRLVGLLIASKEVAPRKSVPASSLLQWAVTELNMDEATIGACLRHLRSFKVPAQQTALRAFAQQGGKCYLTGLPIFGGKTESYAAASALALLGGDPTKPVLAIVAGAFDGLTPPTIIELCRQITRHAASKADVGQPV